MHFTSLQTLKARVQYQMRKKKKTKEQTTSHSKSILPEPLYTVTAVLLLPC